MTSYRHAFIVALAVGVSFACTSSDRRDDDGATSQTPEPECTTSGGQELCTCPDAYVVDGSRCRLRNACDEEENGGCALNAVCRMGSNGKECACAAGAGSGQTCPSTPGVLGLSMHVMDFAYACLNGTTNRDLVISNLGSGTMKITSLTVSSPAYTLVSPPPTPITLAARTTLKLRVAFHPTSTMYSEGELEVVTDSADVETGTQTVTLFGQGYDGESRHFEVACVCDQTTCGLEGAANGSGNVRQPCSYLSFDDVPNGTTLDRVVLLKNSGCESLTVQPAFKGVAPDTAFFSFGTTGSITLQSGESKALKVRFAPTGDQPRYPDVQVTLDSDDTALREGQTTAGTWEIPLLSNSTIP
jgi:hypothetical protein